MVATTLFVAGSTRLTEWSPRFSVHTPPSPTTTRPGRGPTAMVSTTSFVCALTRVNVPPAALVTHTVSSAHATPDGSRAT